LIFSLFLIFSSNKLFAALRTSLSNETDLTAKIINLRPDSTSSEVVATSISPLLGEIKLRSIAP
jgi:hypothetical protein